jgi:hypothetical protein
MKHSSLLIVTTLTLLLTGIVLSHAAGRSETPGAARCRTGFIGETALRYRQGQPTHWRACLLQH